MTVHLKPLWSAPAIASKAISRFCAFGDGISFQVSPHTTVADCEVHSNAGLGLHPGAGSHHTIIRDCDVSGKQGGRALSCWRVAHNLIEGNVRHGVYLRDEPEYNTGHRCTFRDNTIRSNGGPEDAAIWIDGDTTDTRIINNEIADDRETPASCALHVGASAAQVEWEGNTLTGLERIVSPNAAPVDVGDDRP